MAAKGKYRLVCTMEGSWHVEQMIAVSDGTAAPKLYWSTIKSFKEKHQAGYNEATKWMEENL